MSSNNKNEEAARDEAVSYVIDPVRAQEKAADDGDAAAPQLQRALDARHLQMLAIASSIGTGLFIGSGQALRTGGPLALVVSFTWLGAVLTTMMRMSPWNTSSLVALQEANRYRMSLRDGNIVSHVWKFCYICFQIY